MRKIFTVLALVCFGATFAQETGTIAGKLLDKESNNQPLPFANVVVKEPPKVLLQILMVCMKLQMFL